MSGVKTTSNTRVNTKSHEHHIKTVSIKVANPTVTIATEITNCDFTFARLSWNKYNTSMDLGKTVMLELMKDTRMTDLDNLIEGLQAFRDELVKAGIRDDFKEGG